MAKQPPYDPHNPKSVAAFWEGATITHKGKVLGKATASKLKSPTQRNQKMQP